MKIFGVSIGKSQNPPTDPMASTRAALTPRGTPVGRAFTVESGERGDAMRHALAVIDHLHGDGVIPPLIATGNRVALQTQRVVTLPLRQHLKNLFRSKKVQALPQTDPLQPNFDVRAWLEKHPESEDDLPTPCTPSASALRRGFSDCVSPEQDAEEQRLLAERPLGQKEATFAETASTPRTS